MKAKKHIAITINSLRAGGAEKQCILLAEALHKDHIVTLIILDPSDVYVPRLTQLQNQRIKYEFLSKNSLRRIFQLISFFKREQIEFIFAFLPTDTVLSAICGRIARVPYIFGGIRSSFLPKIKFLILRIVNNYLLDYTISNNFSARTSAIDLGFNSNIFVIPNGIAIRDSVTRTSTDIVKIISLGRLVEAKQYDIALKAISSLKTLIANDFKISYSIVGQGPLEDEIYRLIQTYNLEKEVDVITNATDMYALLDDSDIYLCSSSFEGISNALMEAMNCNLPIVATDVGDNSKLVIDKSSGFLVDASNYKELASKLFKLVESDALRQKMGGYGYAHLIKNYGFISFQRKYLKIISDVEDIEIRDGQLTIT